MNTEEFLRNSYDPVTIGFYLSATEICTEEMVVNTQNLNIKLKEIKKKYPNSYVDGFWCGDGEIVAHATYYKEGSNV